MNRLKCENCCFYWFNEDVRRECCNYHEPWPAPCEEEETEDETPDYYDDHHEYDEYNEDYEDAYRDGQED